MNRNKTNWILDAVLFAAFVLAFWLDLTGLGLHQWLGVGIAAFIGVHLLLHWKWVVNVTARFFKRTSNQARMYYVIDLALLFGLSVISITGLVISTWLDLPLVNYNVWRVVHVYTSIFTLGVLVLKIGVHWRWIARTAKKYFSPQLPQPSSQAALQTYRTEPSGTVSAEKANQSKVTRKEFIRLMGVVGVSAFVSAFGVLNDEFGFGQAVDGAAASDTTTNEVVSNVASVDEATTGAVASADTAVADTESSFYTQSNNPHSRGHGGRGKPSSDSAVSGSTSSELMASDTISASETATSADTATSSSQSSASCTVRCNKGCSYPGHCP